MLPNTVFIYWILKSYEFDYCSIWYFDIWFRLYIIGLKTLPLLYFFIFVYFKKKIKKNANL